MLTNRYLPSLFIGVFSIFPVSGAAADLTITGNSLKPVTITPDKSTGLDKIYVLYSMQGVTLSYRASSERVVWYRYSNLGGGFAEEVPSRLENGISTLETTEGDMGYIIEDGDTRSYFWVVDYLPKRCELRSVELSPESGCDETILDIDASAAPIVFYTINGQRRVLSRDINIDYYSLSWDPNTEQYIQGELKKTVESIDGDVRITPPVYCSTSFTVSGDRFLKFWNWEEQIESEVVQPIAVAVETTATQSEAPESDLESNIINSNDTELGGSAPAEITFRAYVTDAVIHHEWQMARDPEFEVLDNRITQQDLTYTFINEGTYYIRYIGSNADGSCEAFSDTYTVNIGESQLICPNAFSPNGDGINDIWRIAYRSLLDFKCWIFDRNGKQIYYYDNPDGGWDGKGAKPGVYYYVIQATGADGKKYKKSGDINIIKYVGGTSSNNPVVN